MQARLDISAVGFWSPGQRVSDKRVFDHNAQKRSRKEETLQRTCVEC